MNIKTRSEIQSLDDDLNLFQSSDWSFLDISEDKTQNYEYFNDIRDLDFDERGTFMKDILSVVVLIIGLTLMILIAGSVTGFFNFNKDINDSGNLVQEKGVEYIEGGVLCENDDMIDISKVLQSYFNTLRNKESYENLNNLCKDGSSFNNTYLGFTSEIQESFDLYDCYARVLREFGSFCRVNKIDKVYIKDGIYYCYVDLNIPSSSDIYEYVYLYSYSMNKYFLKNDISEQNMIRFLLDNLETSTIPCSNSNFCFKFEKQENGVFNLLDDSIITESCTNAYTNAVTQMSKLLNSGDIK